MGLVQEHAVDGPRSSIGENCGPSDQLSFRLHVFAQDDDGAVFHELQAASG